MKPFTCPDPTCGGGFHRTVLGYIRRDAVLWLLPGTVVDGLERIVCPACGSCALWDGQVRWLPIDVNVDVTP